MLLLLDEHWLGFWDLFPGAGYFCWKDGEGTCRTLQGDLSHLSHPTSIPGCWDPLSKCSFIQKGEPCVCCCAVLPIGQHWDLGCFGRCQDGGWDLGISPEVLEPSRSFPAAFAGDLTEHALPLPPAWLHPWSYMQGPYSHPSGSSPAIGCPRREFFGARPPLCLQL